MLSVAQGHYVGFFLWNIVPKVLRQHCTGFFPLQYYLQPLGQYCARFLPVQCCPKRFMAILNRIFPMQRCLENIAQGFYLCNIVPRVLRQDWTKFFTSTVVWRFLDNITQGIYLCNVVPRELRQHWTGFFLVQYCLNPQGQHCLGYLLVQCCPKSIKKTLNRIFYCAMLSGTSWATLRKVFTCAMLAHCWQTTFLSKRTYTMLSIKPGQHYIWILYTQCCRNTSETTLHKKITGAMLAQTT